MLKQINDGIWTISAEFKAFGLIQLNGRATVIKLNDGSLWVHSPVSLSVELKAQIDELGPVKHLIAPSLLHHLYVPAWLDAYPEAEVYAPMGLGKKQPNLKVDHFLSDGEHATSFQWSAEVDHIPLRGMPAVREHLFYHRASQTCLVTDLCFYFREASSFTKLYLKFNKVYQNLGVPKVFKMMIKDKSSFKRSLDEVKSWEVKTLSLCHHALLQEAELMGWREIIDMERF